MTALQDQLTIVEANIAAEISAAGAAATQAKINNDLGQEEQAVQWDFAATKTSLSIAQLNTLINVPPDVTPTPPLPSTSQLEFGVFHGNDQPPAVAAPRMLDYCDGTLASSYTFSPARTAYMKGKQPMVKAGILTSAQAVAFAKVLIAAGFPNADVPHLWEGNQDIANWTNWNEKDYTAPEFITQMLMQIAAMDSVPGAKFNHWWCPNLGQQSAQATGRNQLDTWPGIGPNKNIGVAPDGYFASSDGSDILAQLPLYENLAKSAGARFGGLCEVGVNNGSNNSTDLDIPAAWTNLIAHAKAFVQFDGTFGYEFLMNFATKTTSGGSFNSDNSPADISAIQEAFAA